MQTSSPLPLSPRQSPPRTVNFSLSDSLLRSEAIKPAPRPIDKLVGALPEVYQPIYNHPEFSDRVMRKCEDRLAHITNIYKILESKLNRPLRVLDLGCSQGFFSLSLAELGATVHGIDYHDVNIAVCNFLASEHPALKVTFQIGHIENLLPHLVQGQFDLVLGLSVFHHTVHKSGLPAVQKMLSDLADKIIMGVFELALASEPPYWASAQPKNPRDLLSGFAFVHEFAQNVTHLSSVTRPLYIASNRCWLLNQDAGVFEAWKSESHVFNHGSHHGTRRYFFGYGFVAALFYLDNPECREGNLREHNNALAFLQNPPADLKVPQLSLAGQHEREAWMVREFLPGELLIDLILASKPYDAKRVMHDILDQLAAMESVGLYHEDIRTWNVLIASDGHATLIDYGAISGNEKDCAWPRNIFLSFVTFMHEVISGRMGNTDPLRSPRFNPDTLPEPYRSVLWNLLATPPAEWRFARLRDKFLQAEQNGVEPSETAQPGIAMAFQAMEDVCTIYQGSTNYWRRRAMELESVSKQLQNTLYDLMMQGKQS